MAESLQNYVHLVSGFTRTTRARALAAARALLAQAGLEEVTNDATGRVGKLAEEIMNASRANRELLQNLVTSEVERASARLGFARADEVQRLRDELAELRARVTVAERAAAAAPSAGAQGGTPAEAFAEQSTAKRAPAKRAPIKVAPAKRAPAARKTAATTARTRNAPVRKAAGRDSVDVQLAPGAETAEQVEQADA